MNVQAQKPLAPGTTLPSVQNALQRLDGASVSPRQLTGAEGTVFIFWSTRCPWVDRYEDRVQALVSEYQDQGIHFILVNANEGETVDAIRRQAKNQGGEATYVRDPNATFARALGATRTPHAFLFNDAQTLVYVGAIDDSPSSPKRVNEQYLREAIQAVGGDQAVEGTRRKAFGCALRYP
jgi:thiol-disulfide isomerase/thioredoxin